MYYFFYALSVLVGTVVGVGVFALPYAARESGFFVVCGYLAALAVLVSVIHLLWGEIYLRTENDHRLPGLAATYLGRWATYLAKALTLIGVSGSLFVYTLLGGKFLFHLAGGSHEAWYVFIFWGTCTLLVILGLKTFEFSEFFMGIILIGIMGSVFFVALPHIHASNFFDARNEHLFLPYGIIFFSLLGSAAIPEIRAILRGNERLLKKVIIGGTIIPAFLYFLFTLAVFGVSGAETSRDAISGFNAVIGDGFSVFLYLFGLLAVATSYLTLSIYFGKTLSLDFHIPRARALVLSAGIPLFLIFSGIQDFITIIVIMGGVLGGVEGILALMIYRVAKKSGERTPEYTLQIGTFSYVLLFLVFSLGIVATLFARG